MPDDAFPLPPNASDLSLRYLELLTLKNPDPDTYPAMLEVLAADWAETYGPDSIVAEKLRQRADYFRAVGAF